MGVNFPNPDQALLGSLLAPLDKATLESSQILPVRKRPNLPGVMKNAPALNDGGVASENLPSRRGPRRLTMFALG